MKMNHFVLFDHKKHLKDHILTFSHLTAPRKCRRDTQHKINWPPKARIHTFSPATEAFREQNGRGFN